MKNSKNNKCIENSMITENRRVLKNAKIVRVEHTL